MLDDDHDVRAVLAELRRLGGDTGRAEDHCMDLAASLVGERARGGHRLERDFAQLTGAGLGVSQDIWHVVDDPRELSLPCAAAAPAP
jgi:hypothetical protein